MDMTYSDMYMLLQREPEAKKYFETLPKYVQEQVSTRAQGVNSFASLRDYADNLLRGDD